MKKIWTKEKVFEEARNYKTKKEFFIGCGSAYNVARKNGWFSEMTWFEDGYKKDRKWSNEKLFKEARKYQTITEFSKKNYGAYHNALKKGLIDKMDWFKKQHKPNGYWTKERVFKKAKEYQTRCEFYKGCPRAYTIALKNGWLDEMPWLVDGRVKMLTDKNDSVYKYYWEETNTIYIGRTLMRRQKERDGEHIFNIKDTVYKYAKENGLVIPPMEIIEENITVKEALEKEDYWVNYYKEKGYNVLNVGKTGIGSGSLGGIANGKWNRETVFKKAKEYKTRSEFSKGCSGAYAVARRNGWLDEMTWFKNGYIIEMQRRKELKKGVA